MVAKYKGREYSGDTSVFVYVAIKDIISEKDLEYRHKNVRFELLLDKPELAFTLTSGSYKEIQRMFSNLINNAVNAMPEGGTIKVECYKTDSNLILQFCDQGQGITEDKINKLLSPTEAKEAGIGLGLQHAKEYMKKHGGDLKIKSTVGVGTTVTLCGQKNLKEFPFKEKIFIIRMRREIGLRRLALLMLYCVIMSLWAVKRADLIFWNRFNMFNAINI